MTPEEFMQLYERKTARRHFEDVDPLIADDAVFWFNDGSFSGKYAIKKAFNQTWALEIQDEKYWLDNIIWLAKGEEFAVCTFSLSLDRCGKGEVQESRGWAGNMRFEEVRIGVENCPRAFEPRTPTAFLSLVYPFSSARALSSLPTSETPRLAQLI
jgi:hypothetical protein